MRTLKIAVIVGVCAFLGPTGLAQESDAALQRAIKEAEKLLSEGQAAFKDGKFDAARIAVKRITKILGEAPRADKNRKVMSIRYPLGVLSWNVGDLECEKTAWSQVVAFYESVNADENPDERKWLQNARGFWAATLARSGDFAPALKLQKKVISIWMKVCKPDDPRLLKARSEYAITLNKMGEMEKARTIMREVRGHWEKTFAAADPADKDNFRGIFYGTQKARLDLGNALHDISNGQDLTAPKLRRTVVEAFEKHFPDDRDMLLNAKIELSSSYVVIRDLERARKLLDGAIKDLREDFPEDHSYLLNARRDLAYLLHMQGDFTKSQLTSEDVLKIQLASHRESAVETQLTRTNLARLYIFMGKHENARLLSKQATESLEGQVPETSPLLMNTRVVNASALLALGKHEEGLKILEDVVALYRKKPARRVAPCIGDLACAYLAKGDLKAASRTFEEAFDELHPNYHDYSSLAYFRRAWALTLSGLRLQTKGRLRVAATARLRKLLETIVSEGQALLERTVALSPRETGEVAAEVSRTTEMILSLLPKDALFQRRAFEVLESTRGAAARTAAVVARNLDKIVDVRETAWEAVAKEGRVIAAAEDSDEPETLSKELDEAGTRRESAIRMLLKKCGKEGFSFLDISVKSLADKLPDGTAAVAFRRMSMWNPRPVKGSVGNKEDRLVAHVVLKNKADGKLIFLDLCSIKELHDAVHDYRDSIGRSMRSKEYKGNKKLERKRGARLYEIVLKQVVKKIGKIRKLHVCLDDALHLVPLNALPMNTRSKVLFGDNYRLYYESSFDRLLNPRPKPGVPESLLAVGGVSYNGKLEKEPAPAPTQTPAPPPIRGGNPSGFFEPLPKTLEEATAVQNLFNEVYAGKESKILSKMGATKGALVNQLTKFRFIHVATHGYFAPEAVSSFDDPEADGQTWRPASLQETVVGLAPMTLCGLALSGANTSQKGEPHRGILTAQELARLNLGNCELAVLSACETNRGILRSGQGVQSLQAALHAAGVRTAVTSLWEVDGPATRRLMGQFYHHVFVLKEGKAEALRLAKKTLRKKKGTPTVDWAGFVLTGDPN